MNTKRDEVLGELRAFVAREILDGKDTGLDAETPLLEWGLINSFSLVSLQAFVASRFGVEIPHAQLVAANLKNLGTLADLVVRLEHAHAA